VALRSSINRAPWRGRRARRSAYRLLHRGTETLLEHKTLPAGRPYFFRTGSTMSRRLTQEHAFCLATDKLLGITVAQARSGLIRVLYMRDCPLALAPCLRRHNASDGCRRGDTAAVGLSRSGEADGIYERASGARMHANYFRIAACMPGSAAEAPPTTFCILRSRSSIVSTTSRVLPDGQSISSTSRNVGIARSQLAYAWGWGCSGFMVRFSVAAWTCSKRSALRMLCRISMVDIPVGKNGDCYDRLCSCAWKDVAAIRCAA